VIANQACIQGAGWHSHIQRSGWDEIYELVRGLQQQGFVAGVDIYPYVSGLPNAASVTPEYFEMIGQNIEESLMDPETGEYLNAEQLLELHKTQPEKIVVAFMGKADEEGWVKMEDISYGCDAVPVMDKDWNPLPLDFPTEKYSSHPRIVGTFSKMFRLAREYDVPLMNIVNNASFIPAKYLSTLGLPGMLERGRMQEGMVADITIFNPETIRENATFKIGERALQPTGIPHVIVNGQFVIREGKVDFDIRPGQPIRYPVMTGPEDSATSDSDEAAIKEVIVSAYVDGIQIDPNVKLVKKGFHPDFNMYVKQDGKLVKVSRDELVATVAKMEKAKEKAKKEVTYTFEAVDVVGKTGNAKLIVYKDGKLTFSDYFLLYHFDDGWKIVAKHYEEHK
jgi:N-acyl-D-glutamate deacylase